MITSTCQTSRSPVLQLCENEDMNRDSNAETCVSLSRPFWQNAIKYNISNEKRL